MALPPPRRAAAGGPAGAAAALGAPVAVVLNAGFASAKGGMLRGMLHPTRHRLRFTGDALRFIGVMFLIGLVFYVWSAVVMVQLGATVRRGGWGWFGLV